MRNQHTLHRPSENPVECRSRRTTIEETHAPITRRARIGRDNPAEPSNHATPPLEPVARKILDQIGEQRGVAVTVKEHYLGQVKAPVQHNLVVAKGSSVIGGTPTFSGGTKTLVVNLKPGTYTFYCSVPGHRMAGMQGTLTVVK